MSFTHVILQHSRMIHYWVFNVFDSISNSSIVSFFDDRLPIGQTLCYLTTSTSRTFFIWRKCELTLIRLNDRTESKLLNLFDLTPKFLEKSSWYPRDITPALSNNLQGVTLDINYSIYSFPENFNTFCTIVLWPLPISLVSLANKC